MEQGPPINRQDIRQQAFDQKMICSITPLVDACRPQVPCFSLVYIFFSGQTPPRPLTKRTYMPDSNKNLEYYGRHYYMTTAAKADAFLQWLFSVPNTIYCQFRQFIQKV